MNSMVVRLSLIVALIASILFWIFNADRSLIKQSDVNSITDNSEIQSPAEGLATSHNSTKASVEPSFIPSNVSFDDHDNSDIYVRMERITQDQAYNKRIKRHSAIKTYLHSTRKDEPEYQELLQKLLSNGLNIEHWQPAASIILFKRAFELNETKTMRIEGYTDEEIAQRIQELPSSYPKIYNRFKEDMSHILGVNNQEFIDSLIEIPLNFKENEYIFGKPGLMLFEEGEKILTDEDWLTNSLREIQNNASLKQ
jgi:hypothetical protein